MTNYNAQNISRIVREYFDDIKKIPYLFEVDSVNYDKSNKVWLVVCTIRNLFENDQINYIITVSDNGDILNVGKPSL